MQDELLNNMSTNMFNSLIARYSRFRVNMDMEDVVYDLTYLRNIKKITGALIVKNVATELQSLTFLQNLVTIENKGNDSLAIEIADVS